MDVINDMIWLCLIMSISCCNECMNERKEMEVLWFRPCTEMFAGRSNECTYWISPVYGDVCGLVQRMYLHRRFGVTLCRTEYISFILQDESCALQFMNEFMQLNNNKNSIFSRHLFWFWFWFLNFDLILKFEFSPCSKYLFIYFKNFVFARSKYFELIVLFLLFVYNLILYELLFCFAYSYLFELFILAK